MNLQGMESRNMSLINLWNGREANQQELSVVKEKLERYRAMVRLAGAEVEHRNRVIRKLTAFTFQTSQMTEPAALFRVALNQALETTKAQMGAIVLIDPDSKALTLGAHRGLTPDLVHILTGRQFDAGAAVLMPHLVTGKGALIEQNDTTDEAETLLLEISETTSLVSLPLKTGHQLLGALVLGLQDESRFLPADLHCLLAIAQVTAVSWDSLHLREKLWRMAESLLSQGAQIHTGLFGRTLETAVPALPPLQAKLANMVADLGGAMGAVFIIDTEQKDMPVGLAADYGLSPLFTSSHAITRLSEGLFPFDQLIKQNLLIKDITKAYKNMPIPLLKNLADEGARSLIALHVPHFNHRTKLFLVASTTPNAFSSRDLDRLLPLAQKLLPMLTDLKLPTFPMRSIHVPSLEPVGATEDDLEQLLAAIMDAEEEVERHNTDFATLNQISALLNRTLNLHKTMPDVLRSLQEMLEVDAVWLYVVDKSEEGRNMMKLTAHIGLDEAYSRTVTTISIGDGFEGAVAKAEKQRVINDTSKDSLDCHVLMELESMQALTAVPLTCPEEVEGEETQRLLGVLTTGKRSVHYWQPRQIRLLSTVANQMAFAINNAQLYNQVKDNMNLLDMSNQVLQRINRTLIENPIGINLKSGK